jgi:uncharacterized protein DUF4261
MSNPSAFVLFDASTKLHTSAILRALSERHPDQPIVNFSGDGADTSSTLLTVAGVTVVLMQFDARLPEGWQPAAKRAIVHWPEAEAAFGRHRAHISVAVMGEDNDRLRVARVVTAVVGALAATHPQSSAVLWDLAVANSSSVFAEFSHSAFAPYPDFPSGLWVSTQPFRDQGAKIGAVTIGLRNFTGREIELEGLASQLKSILITARGLVNYLLQDSAAIRDGDTIGASATEQIQVHFKDSDRFGGLPIIAATMPAAEASHV